MAAGKLRLNLLQLQVRRLIPNSSFGDYHLLTQVHEVFVIVSLASGRVFAFLRGLESLLLVASELGRWQLQLDLELRWTVCTLNLVDDAAVVVR